MSTEHELLAWLGPAADQLTAEQIQRLSREAEAISRRYDPDLHEEREAALSAAVRYLLGDTTLDEVGAERRRTLNAESVARAAAIQVAAMYAEDHAISERQLAERSGIDRQTLRARLGKQSSR